MNIKEKKRILLAEYFTENELKGGVQTSMSDFLKWRDVDVVKNVSANYASSIIGYPLTGDYHFSRSRAISNYVSCYTKVNPVDFVIQNSIVARMSKYSCPSVSVINDNNIRGTDICANHGVIRPEAYDVLANKLLTCQISSCKMSDAVVSVSEHVRQDYYEKLGIESTVVSPAINVDYVLQKDDNLMKKVRNEIGLPEKQKTAIVVSSFYPVKGWDITAEIIRNHKDINWIVVNSSNDKSLRTKRENVLYLGMLDREKLMRTYLAADFILNTSRYESFCISALEAMACDVPVIMGNTGFSWKKKGVTDYGIIVEDYGEYGFSNAIDSFYKSSYSFEPRYHVEAHYGIERWKKGWRGILNSL